MAYQIEDNSLAALLPLLTGTSDNPLVESLTALLNAAMQIEREKHIGVGAYERGADRNGQRNGFKERTVATRLGKLSVSIPHTTVAVCGECSKYVGAMSRSTHIAWTQLGYLRRHLRSP